MNSEMISIFTLKMRDGVDLFLRQYPEKGKGIVLLTHGIGEHSGRYDEFCMKLSSEFTVVTYDLRGHGKSGGKRATISYFDQYVEDLSELIAYLGARFPEKKVSLVGHSMGALITARYLASTAGKMQKNELKVNAVVLSAPPFGMGAFLGRMLFSLPKFILKFFSYLPLNIPLRGAVDLSNLSTVKRVKEDYVSDPLVILGPRLKLFLSLIYSAKELSLRMSELWEASIPLAVCFGSNDKIISVSALARIKDFVDFNEYEGGYHELHNEKDELKNNYFTKVISYLKERELQ